MKIQSVPFSITEWGKIPPEEKKGEAGVSYWQTFEQGNLRVRMVEYSPGFRSDHWCSRAVSMANMPLITTSANITGENFMTSMEDLHPDIKAHLNFMIYEGELAGRPSKIVNLTQDSVEIKER